METPEDGTIQLQDVAAGGGSASASYTKDGSDGQCCVASPGGWLGRLSRELHWSFLFAVVSVYGACQGVGDALNGVASGYYWKDVQRVQPSAAQFYQGITGAPWVIKPLWGLLSDVVPVAGYRRRPYLVLAGAIGVTSMLMLSLHRELGIIAAVLALTAQSTGAAIADVTVDALIAQKSITHPPLASDMQSMCGFSSSVGALIGFSISGLLVHSMGSQANSAWIFKEGCSTGTLTLLLDQHFQRRTNANSNLMDGQYNIVCLFAKLLKYTLDNLHYHLTEHLPCVVQGFIGLIYSIGSVGSILGVLLYQGALKDYSLRSMLLWSQVLASLAGMLDLVLVARLNLKMGIPDYFFAVIDNSVSQMVGQLIWLPLLVLSSKLCPSGIEGTFYALLMSIQNAGAMISAWWGGIMLDMLNVTRTEFHNLWIAVLIRNISRLAPLMLLFLVPQSDHDSRLLPVEMLDNIESSEAVKAGSDSTGFSILVADDSSGLSSNAVVQKEEIEEFHAGTADVELIPLVNKSRPTIDS
ncbi:hypothetical protein HU200_031727 [Digitaria exilis]|uniref:Uncharacterized protein n=1 Tax=Digitaria exilis TaxID=1010633 RepID=A0A835C140_9POAL|nr:hypothetical protein HU200_031727 [Digitaria exilis]